MRKRSRFAALLAALAGAALALAACQPHQFTAATLEPAKPLADFELPAADGSTFRLSDHRGELLLVYFGYTFCPDVCPTTMLEARRAVEALGDDAENVRLVMVSVDPDRDTPDRLQEYVTNFHPTFMGARTTDLDALDAVLADFGAYYQIEEAPEGSDNYPVTHTASLFLVDREGRLRALFPYGATGQQIADDLRQLLRD